MHLNNRMKIAGAIAVVAAVSVGATSAAAMSSFGRQAAGIEKRISAQGCTPDGVSDPCAGRECGYAAVAQLFSPCSEVRGVQPFTSQDNGDSAPPGGGGDLVEDLELVRSSVGATSRTSTDLGVRLVRGEGNDLVGHGQDFHAPSVISGGRGFPRFLAEGVHREG